MYAKKSSAFKLIALMLCLALLIGGAIGGTLAYLMTKTEPVTNTFVAGNIGTLKLDETEPASRTGIIVTPGVDIEKNPTVTFSGNNVPAYVFLKVKAIGWTVNEKQYSCVNGMVTWTIGDNWTYLKVENTNEYVYYKAVDADESLDAEAIKGSSITVDAEITKENLANFAEKTLEFSAYAVQQANGAGTTFKAEEAWAVALNNGQPVTNP